MIGTTLITIGMFVAFFLVIILLHRKNKKKYGAEYEEMLKKYRAKELKSKDNFSGSSGLSDDYLVSRRYKDW